MMTSRSRTFRTRLPALFLAPVLALAAAAPANSQNQSCTMQFQMQGWSVFYKTASGTGTVRCDNGQQMRVRLSSRGGGLSFGKSSIEDGQGTFSGVRHIDEILGSYVTAEAHAGALKSARGQVMTKGVVSLALAGTGRGWDLGVAFGRFTIERMP